MNSVKQRILTGWSFIRVLYLAMGMLVVVQSIATRQWVGVLLGLYFASMGLLGLGCAGGYCFPSNADQKPDKKNESRFKEIHYEEIKEK
jgi:hypothetical protein